MDMHESQDLGKDAGCRIQKWLLASLFVVLMGYAADSFVTFFFYCFAIQQHDVSFSCFFCLSFDSFVLF